jgi:hypothetical protein
MAKVKLSPAVAVISGKVGDMLFRSLFGKQVVGRPPDFGKRTWSTMQRAQIGRFGTRGRAWKKLPAEIKARYTARAKELNMPPCGLYQKTAACPPQLQEVDLSKYTGQPGQVIRIAALDLVDLAEVRVIIRDGTGTQLEAGSATLSPEGMHDWVYTTTTAASSTAGLSVEAIVVNWAGQEANRIELQK